jgi:hypothetical protein
MTGFNSFVYGERQVFVDSHDHHQAQVPGLVLVLGYMTLMSQPIKPKGDLKHKTHMYQLETKINQTKTIPCQTSPT